jgi:hypothetical protein
MYIYITKRKRTLFEQLFFRSNHLHFIPLNLTNHPDFPHHQSRGNLLHKNALASKCPIRPKQKIKKQLKLI